MWQTRYIAPDKDKWLMRRPDIPALMTFAQHMSLLNLLTDTIKKPKPLSFALLGFESDEGVKRNLGRPGAMAGPDAIREMLAKFPVNRAQIACLDVGDIACFDGDLETAQAALGQVVAQLLKAGFIPILLGGGHEIAWGHYLGIRKHYPKQKLGIVNFDAHFDMRPLPSHGHTSGTPFLQIAEHDRYHQLAFSYSCLGIQPSSNIAQLFATANQFNVKFLLAEELHLAGNKKALSLLKRILKQNELLYVSLCLDVFASCFAPGVSAPQPLGLTPWQILPLLRLLASSGKVKTYDIAELCPARDNDQITAKLAASLIYEIVHSQR